MATRITLDLDGAIARLTLTSDDGENRIAAATLGDLRDVCAALADLPAVRAAIVTGAGGVFSAGWAPALLAESAELGEGDPFGCLAELGLPVIAALNGDAFSAGLELALACDLRVAAGSARFALPETAFGLLPLAGGTQRLPRLVGRGRALAMILLGEVIDAATALDWGLVNTVGDDATALATELGQTIAQRGPIAERFAKEALSNGVELPLARALRYELDLTVLLQTTADRAEGVRAFVEKRPPRFTGS